jgi:hypothetical protein
VPGVTTEESGFVYFYINGIKKAFVDSLRVAFSHNATPLKYRYDKDALKSQIDIRSDYANRVTKLPAPIINVQAGNGNANVTYVGDEFNRTATTEIDGVDGYIFGGILKLNVDVNISANSARDLEHLSDLVTLYMRYLFREKFYENNMAYV